MPTRLDNILNLLLTTNPDLVEKVSVYPGMSDHAVVTASINITAELNKKPPRKVYIFKNMDEEGIKRAANQSKKEFFQSNLENQNSTNKNWTLLKSKINELLTDHVPEKVIRQRWDVPWMTQPIRRLIRKKKRVDNAYKHHKNSKTWEKFKTLRKTVQKQL